MLYPTRYHASLKTGLLPHPHLFTVDGSAWHYSLKGNGNDKSGNLIST